MSKSRVVTMTVVSIKEAVEFNAFLIKAEGELGTRLTWFEQVKPSYTIGQKLKVEISF